MTGILIAQIVHKPSFNIAKAPRALLITMTLFGTALSPRYSDVVAAREWFDLAEELAFVKRCHKKSKQITKVPK